MQRSTAIAASLCLLFAASTSRASDAPEFEPLYRMVAGGSVQIAPDGSVAAVEVEPAVKDAKLRESLGRSVGKLRFEPVRIKGEAVLAKVGFEAVLIGRPQGAGMAVSFDSVDFIAPKGEKPVAVDGEQGITPKRLTPPKYPMGPQLKLRMGRVKLAIRVGANGRAAEVAAIDSLVYDFKFPPGHVKSTLAEFERAAVMAARGWTFNVPADAASRSAEDMTVTTSVLYTFDLKDGMTLEDRGQWFPVLQAPKRAIAWVPKAASERLAETGNTPDMAGTGPYRLLAPVAGTAIP